MEKQLTQTQAKIEEIVAYIDGLSEDKKQRLLKQSLDKYHKLVEKIEGKEAKLQKLDLIPKNQELLNSVRGLTMAGGMVFALVTLGMIQPDNFENFNAETLADPNAGVTLLAGALMIGVPLALMNVVVYLKNPVENLIVKTRIRKLKKQIAELDKKAEIEEAIIETIGEEEIIW